MRDEWCIFMLPHDGIEGAWKVGRHANDNNNNNNNNNNKNKNKNNNYNNYRIMIITTIITNSCETRLWSFS